MVEGIDEIKNLGTKETPVQSAVNETPIGDDQQADALKQTYGDINELKK